METNHLLNSTDVRIISIPYYNVYIPVGSTEVKSVKKFLKKNFVQLKKKIKVFREQDLLKKHGGNIVLKFEKMVGALKICRIERCHKKIYWNTMG